MEVQGPRTRQRTLETQPSLLRAHIMESASERQSNKASPGRSKFECKLRRRTVVTLLLPIRTRKAITLARLAAFAHALPLAAAQHTTACGLIQRVSSQSLAVGRVLGQTRLAGRLAGRRARRAQLASGRRTARSIGQRLHLQQMDMANVSVPWQRQQRVEPLTDASTCH